MAYLTILNADVFFRLKSKIAELEEVRIEAYIGELKELIQLYRQN
jgi:hypothetical protein